MTLRLLFLTNFYPPLELGGMEQLCQEVVTRLAERGHATQVLTSRHGVSACPPPEQGVTRALYLQADVNHYQPNDFFLKRPWQEQANKQALHQAIEAFSPDLVFVWGMWNLSRSLAYWAEQWLPRRVTYMIADHWPAEPDMHEYYWRLPARRRAVECLKFAVRPLALRQIRRERETHTLLLEHVTCVSEHVRDKLNSAGALPHNARVIYNGIDPEPFIQSAADRSLFGNSLRLVYVGGLLAHKGVHTALEALGLLQERGQVAGLTLAVIGGGHPDYEAHLRDLVDRLALNDRVVFKGRVPRDQIPAILAREDLFLFTSIGEEAIARTVMEAMASGLAVVATPVGGQREMLADGENALIFAPGDAAGLADKIMMLKDSPRLVQQLAAAGRRTVLERFTLKRMVDEVEDYLTEVCSSREQG